MSSNPYYILEIGVITTSRKLMTSKGGASLHLERCIRSTEGASAMHQLSEMHRASWRRISSIQATSGASNGCKASRERASTRCQKHQKEASIASTICMTRMYQMSRLSSFGWCGAMGITSRGGVKRTALSSYPNIRNIQPLRLGSRPCIWERCIRAEQLGRDDSTSTRHRLWYPDGSHQRHDWHHDFWGIQHWNTSRRNFQCACRFHKF